MGDKYASVREYILRADVRIALELVRQIALAKAASRESQQMKRSETRGLLPVDLLEADGHRILGVPFEHDLSAQIHS
jgi:hypothetical protein